jgi:hypothetical protein
MTRNTQSERNGRIDNVVDSCFNVGRKDGRSAKFLVPPMRGLPDFAKRPLFGQDNLGVKHAAAAAAAQRRE